MLLKIEHIGIAVADIKKANEVYKQLLGTPNYKEEEVLSENVITSFFKSGESKIELLQATSPESAIARFIEKRGQGIHHIAFEVDDIQAEMNRLKDSGFVILNDKPKKGADNKWVCFVHPQNTCGVLIELTQEIK